MANTYLPTTDSGLGDWSANADPILTLHPAHHGLTVARVAQFHAKRLAFDAALAVVNAPTTRTPVAVEAPELDILQVAGRTVRCRAHGTQANKRGKPPGVAGVAFFSFVGESAPADASQWKLEGSSTRTTFDVSFPQGNPGDKVWLTACWYNPRLQQGPICPASSTNLQFGSVRAAA